METIIFANQKGGVGKTVSSLAVATELAKNYRVLAIDGDPQCNFTYASLSKGFNQTLTLNSVLMKECSIKNCIVKSCIGDFDIVPGDRKLVTADKRFTGISDFSLLKKTLSFAENDYDFCIIDPPPTLGILSLNYFVCADCVIVPLNTSCFSIQGLSTLYQIIDDVKESLNPRLEVLGFLLTNYNPRTKISKEVREALVEIAESKNTRLFYNNIRRSVSVEKAISENKSIYTCSKGVGEDYKNLTKEILTLIGEKK